jgi:hypothetical protein
MVTKKLRAISYEGNTLNTTLPVTTKGKKSKNGKIIIHSNVDGSNDVPSVRTSVSIDPKYIEGADPTREYRLVAGVWSKPKKEAKPKAKGKAEKTSLVVPEVNPDTQALLDAMVLLKKAGVKIG